MKVEVISNDPQQFRITDDGMERFRGTTYAMATHFAMMIEQNDKLKEIISSLPPLELAIGYLDGYSDRLSNDSCNDEELEDTSENRAFIDRINKAEGREEGEGETVDCTTNFLIADYLSRELKETAEKIRKLGINIL